MIIRKDTSWLARTLPSLCDVPITTKAGSGTRPLPPKASPGRIAVFEAPSLSLPSTAFAQREDHPWSTVRFIKTLNTRHISLGRMPHGLFFQGIPQPPYSIITDWQPVTTGTGALWISWMLTVNGHGAIPPAQHTAPGIQQPRRTSQPISQPRFSGPLLPIQSILFTLLFSCVVTIWLTKHCILRKKLSDGKKAHSKRNFPHLKYRLTDKVFIFKRMQLN